MDHQWFVGLSQVVWRIKCFGSYTIPDRSHGKELSAPEGAFFLVVQMVSGAKKLGKHWVRELFYFTFCGEKMLTVVFWTLLYILSVYSSQKALSLCKGRQNRAADDAEQHDQSVAEGAGSHASFIHLTL